MKVKNVILVVCAVVIAAFGCIYLYNKNNDKINNHVSNSNSNEIITGNKPSFEVSRLSRTNNNVETNKKQIFTAYEELSNFIKDLELDEPIKLTEESFNDSEYLGIILEYDSCYDPITSVENGEVKDNKINLLFNYESGCGNCGPENYLYLIKFDKGILKNEYDLDLKYQSISKSTCDPNAEYKPVIYLYPTIDMNVSVKLDKPENLTVSYPKYENGWNVYAKKDGTLIDSKGRNYYALYWEGLNYKINKNLDEGFIVKGENIVEFLEEKLEILGLNERESNEFIMYWLPKLQSNKYNYIRFATIEEINNGMILNIEPKPDSVIRILMVFKPLDEKINVKEQLLETPVRKGFSVVEWGGTELK